jgi:hypothetical protein
MSLGTSYSASNLFPLPGPPVKDRQLHGEHADHFEAAMLERPGARRLRMHPEETPITKEKVRRSSTETRSI